MPLLQQAITMLKSGRIDAAALQCKSYLDLHPQNARALILMSAIFHRQGNEPAALVSLQQAISAFASDTDGVLDALVAMQRIGALDETDRILRTLDPGQAKVQSLLAQNHWLSGRYMEALLGFKHTCTQWPKVAENHQAWARAALRLGDEDGALRIIQNAINQFPDQVSLRRFELACLIDLKGIDFARERSATLPITNLDIALFKSALDSAAGSMPFSDPDLESMPRLDALSRSHNWLLNQPGPTKWLGTGTGLLKWASKHLPAEGPVIECGVFHGLSINLLAKWTGRETHGFDSFEGLPETWKPDEPQGSYSTHGTQPVIEKNVELHAGWFENSLPEFANTLQQPISLLHIDCDLYSSTRTVLDILAPHLQSGSLLVFDDYLGYPGYEQHEFRAAQEHFANSSIRISLVGAVLMGRSVVYQVQ